MKIAILLLSLAVVAWSFPATSIRAQCYGDFDCSGTVDGSDLAIFAEHYGSTTCYTWLGQITGVVGCPGGGAIPGATVYVPGDSFVSITDDAGQFKLRGLPEGVYTLVVLRSGKVIGRADDVEVQSDMITNLSIDAQICDEICDGLDNDFDGLTDEELAPEFCPLLQGVCTGAIKTCGGAAGWLPCDENTYSSHDSAYEAEEMSCDNLDNDCDGVTDGMVQICGTDEGVCMSGIETCTVGAWGDCEGAVWPSPEVCGDELDNDCDGVVDEDCPTS